MISAKEIEAHLSKYIVGQDDAIKTLAVAASQHYARAAYTGETPLRRANVIIVGPTGVGKTAMVRALAAFLDVPFASVTASAITQPGFSGLNPDEVLRLLVQKAGKGNRLAAEGGIAYIDEIDKVARKDTDEGDKQRNLTTGLGVQQNLLDVLDARTWTFENGQQMDASRVLFIVSGAFVGIDRVIERRVHARSTAARPSAPTMGEMLRQMEPSDLIAYGLIPELVGRLPVLVKLRPLDAHEYLRILTEPADAPIRRIVGEFEGIGATLIPEEAWLRSLAIEATVHPLGARALEARIREHIRDAFYDASAGDVIHIGAEGSWWKETKASPGIAPVAACAAEAGSPEPASTTIAP